MYFHILKRDLKRKKTMNIILLLFVILAAMFVSSSVNNIISVVGGLDYYFEQAGVQDYFAATMNKADQSDLAELLNNVEEIDSYGIEPVIYMNPDNLIYDGEPLNTMQNTSVLMAYEDAQITYFDENNNPLKPVEEGTVLLSGKRIRENNMQIGDMLEIKIEDVSITLKIAGSFKDAVLGSDMMGMTRFIVNSKDYDKLIASETVASLYTGDLFYINSSDIKSVEKALSLVDGGIIFMGEKDMLKMTYVMDMIIAGILLIVSICLIAIAFVVLKFTINFTLTEEFREIGVMKAIGIRNKKIRGLYLVKYFVLSVVGVLIGFFVSIPFGNMLLNSVSETTLIGAAGNYMINIICSIAVVIIIVLFGFGCTKKVKSYTPVDAIRSGSTGERFHKKSFLRLNKSHMKTPEFLAVNDVLSNPKRFGTIILAFSLCLMLVLILANSVNTLKSDKLVTTFAMTQSDAYYSNEDRQMKCMGENGEELLQEYFEEIETTLAKNGMPAKCCNEVMLKLTLTNGDNVVKSQVMKGNRTKIEDYVYMEGTAPQNTEEIAITKMTAEKLGVTIGDTITITHMGGDHEYLITALFQSMNNMGEGVRFHEDTPIDYRQTAGFFAIQIDFTDNPDKKEIEDRVEKMKEIFDTDKVWTAGDYVATMVGVADTLDSVKYLILAVSFVIIILITVLMERSFIARERGEIAIIKAIGFSNNAIVRYHTVRLGIAALLSTIVAVALSTPLTELLITPIFKMMGAGYGVEYDIKPLEVFVIYPLLVLVTTMLSAFLTAQYTRTISSSESSNIE